MRRFLPAVLGAVAMTLLLAPPAPAQYYFGKNKVQYKNFEWHVLETENFEVYYYEGTREAVVDAARMAERSYQRLSHILDHRIRDRVPLILYASHADFQSTNIQPGFIGEGTGGVTEFLKRRVYLPFTGSYAELEHVLTHELVHAFQVDILWGGDQGAIGANPFAFQPPLWIMEGSAEYLSMGGLDPNTEMWLRDGALHGYLIPIPTLDYVYDIRVYRYGQAVFEYVGRTYGPEKVGVVLKTVAATRNVDAAFRRATGKTLAQLSEDWTEEMRRTYLPQVKDHEKTERIATQITDHVEDGSSFNLVPGVSPRGDQVAFVSQRKLSTGIYLASTLDGTVLDRLVEGQTGGDLEALRFFNSSIDWSPDGRYIVFPAKTGGRDVIYVYDVEERRRVRTIKPEVDGIASPSWSPDGTELVFTGFVGGRSDLFLVDADGKNLRRLTYDRFSALTPRFHPDGDRIIFTTDRGPDTDYEQLHFGPQRMAVLDLETSVIEVLPGQAGKSISPHYSPDGTQVLFVSDRTGISNLFRLDLLTGRVDQLSDVLTGITGITENSPPLSVSRNGKRAVASAFDRGGWNIFALRDPFTREPVRSDVPAEVVASAEQVRRATGLDELVRDVVSGRLVPASQLTADTPRNPASVSAADLITELVQPGQDPPLVEHLAETRTVPAPPAPPVEEDAATRPAGMEPPAALGPPADDDAGPEDGDLAAAEYSPFLDPFGGEMDRHDRDARSDSLLAALDALPDTSTFTPKNYKSKFSADYGTAAAGAGGGLGVAGQAVIGFSDILGNKQLQIGAAVYGSLTESDLLVRYTDLGHRINYGVELYQFRNSFLLGTTRDTDRYQSNIYRGGEVFLSRPFSTFTRLELALQAVGVSERIFFRDYGTGETLRDDLGTYFYLAPRVTWVKDTAVYGATGPIKGQRHRLSVRQGVGGASFTDLSADLRRYWNLGERFSLASRFLGVTSFGKDPQIYRIGGPLTLRAVDWGALEGSNVLLGSLEFRFPFLDLLDVAFPLPLRFGGIRGAVFFDTGAAWGEQYLISGLTPEEQHAQRVFDPWSTEDGFRLQDLVAAYGFGIRANLGYFLIRWDLARATDFQDSGKWRGFFALGAEF